MLKCTNDSLKLLVLELLDYLLWELISISMFMFVWIVGLEDRQRSKGNNIFTNSLLGTIMQDGSIREKSNDTYGFYSKKPV